MTSPTQSNFEFMPYVCDRN